MPAAAPAAAQPAGEWRYFGGDEGFTRYSPLDQIDHGNVRDLEIVWRRPGVDPVVQEAFPDLRVNAYLRSTPVMIDGALYAPNAVGLLEAFDAGTGETVWRQAAFAATLQEVAGSSTRGAAWWADGSVRRLLFVRGGYLYSVDARTGRPAPGFGLADQGRVDLRWDHPLAGDFGWSAGPIVVGDVVVVAGITGGAGDGGVVREAAPEDIRGFDVRTGELLWTFHVVPRPGEFGTETWGGAAAYSGDLGSWCCLAADEALGHVYVPLSAPTGMVYGGHRPGDNLFSDSLVALDAATGERVWHFQMVHHDVWEYDTVGPPTLGEITVDGRRIRGGDAAQQDRVPLRVRPRDRGAGVADRGAARAPVDRTGRAHVADAAVSLQAAAVRPAGHHRGRLDRLHSRVAGGRPRGRSSPSCSGPCSRRHGRGRGAPDGKVGTLTAPGGWGAGNWHTGAFDPETGIYYAVVPHHAHGVERRPDRGRGRHPGLGDPPGGGAAGADAPAPRAAHHQAPVRAHHRPSTSTAASWRGWPPTATDLGTTHA